jgi:hypothetical protein
LQKEQVGNCVSGNGLYILGRQFEERQFGTTGVYSVKLALDNVSRDTCSKWRWMPYVIIEPSQWLTAGVEYIPKN